MANLNAREYLRQCGCSEVEFNSYVLRASQNPSNDPSTTVGIAKPDPAILTPNISTATVVDSEVRQFERQNAKYYDGK